MAEVLHMVYALLCPTCGSDDAWCIEINGGGDQWDKILGFTCRCGHEVQLKEVITVDREDDSSDKAGDHPDQDGTD